jgi:hypothetical protein
MLKVNEIHRGHDWWVDHRACSFGRELAGMARTGWQWNLPGKEPAVAVEH